MNKNLEYIGEALDYQVYKNSDGFLEGYKSVGAIKKETGGTWKDHKRIVTNATDMAGFENYIKGLKKKPEKKLDLSKLPKLFDDTEL
jgi:hypothetical protein